MDGDELVGYLTRKKLKSIKSRYNLSIITNVFLIGVMVCIGVYIYMNLEEFKSLGQDVCRLCESKTGGTCSLSPYSNSSAGVIKFNPEDFDLNKTLKK
jgi:hypothetical protein